MMMRCFGEQPCLQIGAAGFAGALACTPCHRTWRIATAAAAAGGGGVVGGLGPGRDAVQVALVVVEDCDRRVWRGLPWHTAPPAGGGKASHLLPVAAQQPDDLVLRARTCGRGG